MAFSSVYFLFAFLPLTLLGYFLLPKGWRNLFLLLCSLAFYAFDTPRHLLVLLGSILLNYLSGLLLLRYEQRPRARKAVLALSIGLNLLLLVVFKYLTFLLSSADRFLHLPWAVPNIVLPIGISFFTFQGMSYVIDVYRKDAVGNRSLGGIALYIALFPQLIAGPIVKYKDIDTQLRRRTVSLAGFAGGIERFVTGLSKKVLIADVLGELVDRVFGTLSVGLDTPTAWLCLLCYTFQIYFDFSGYSDMAIGLGKMFGFRFMENFNYPYISRSITEFWRRWHISLSTWFREYLYIPLGGNRRGNVYLHLLIVFCATGIWHGASWQFLLWGLWHGLFIILERLVRDRAWYRRIPAGIQWLGTLGVVVLGWVLFRAEDIVQAGSYFATLFGFQRSSHVPFAFAYFANRRILSTLPLAALGATPLLRNLGLRFGQSPLLLLGKRLLLLGLFGLCVVYMMSGSYSPFIYFRF